MLTLQLFNGRTGAHIQRLNASKFNWSDSINEDGSLDATTQDPYAFSFSPYAHIIAAIDDMDVIHAGYLTRAKFSHEKNLWELSAGGALAILEKRLVLNHALSSSWKDGNVVVDEDHPSGNWPLKLKGSYRDIISRHLRETLKWGTLPIVPSDLTGGSHELNYNSYDLATVAACIEDIGDLDNGPETRFDARIGSDGSIKFYQTTSSDGGEIVTNDWMWNACVPDSGVILGDRDFDGEDGMCTQAYATGGRDEDKLLVARAVSSRLVDQGWPVMQIANKDHATVSKLSTLKSYVNSDVNLGDQPQAVHALKVDRSKYRVRVGDHATLRFGPNDADTMKLKITDVSGSSDGQMLDLQCRERE